ncbi:MAG: hypothetical protein II008_09985 [Oscillospiraceae bacterium]|nr:hypothetical protein [Oscillospiraceae bacterium]
MTELRLNGFDGQPGIGLSVALRAAAEQRAASGFCDLRIADDDPATTLRTLNEAIEA